MSPSAPNGSPGIAHLRRPANRRLMWLVALLALMAVLAVCSVAYGVRDISWRDAFAALTGTVETTDQVAAITRLPRTVMAVLIGAALAVAGTTMQAVTRNPLADPGIFGVLGGAALAVVIALAFFGVTGTLGQGIVATVGATSAAIFVYAVGSLGHGGATGLKLALAGAATSAAASSLVSAILLPRVDVMESFRFWQIGSIADANWSTIAHAVAFLVVGALLCLGCARGLNSMALGDDAATGLGENVQRTRLVASLGAVILCGIATASAGPIGFVGLVVPHVCRLLVGTDHRWLMPFSAIGGACLLLASDTLGRLVVDRSDVAVGILTPIVGAPVFIWIVRREKVREL